MTLIPPFLSILAIFVSSVALGFAAKNFYMKRGTKLSGQFSFVSSADCEDRYVSHILLENQKERSIVIFEILLQIGPNIYLEIENFEKSPLILRPYEVYRKDYEPIEFYSVNLRRVEVNRLISDTRVRKRIVLSTSNGRYNVSSFLPKWYPLGDYFRNHQTAHIHPHRMSYKGKSYGSNILFLAEFKKGKNEEVVPIRANDYEIKRFKNFQLTRDSLKTKRSLTSFLQHQKRKKKITADKVTVIDLAELRKKDSYWNLEGETYSIPKIGWFTYYVLGRLKTYLDDAKLHRKNKSALKKIKPR
jgi:hypothetical protein